MSILEATDKERRGAAISEFIEAPEWKEFDKSAYECRVLLCPEDNGGYSAHALRLPGVVSQGDSVSEALANIGEAFTAAISVYLDSGEDIPWEELSIDRPKGSIERWILVNV